MGNNREGAENNVQQDVIDYVKQAKLDVNEMVADPSVDINRKGNVLTIDTGPAVVIVKLKSDNKAQDNAAAESTSTGTVTAANKTQARREPITQREDEIKKLRDEGLTQREVAKIMGTTQANISKIERAMKSRAQKQEASKHAAKAEPVASTASEHSSTGQ
ncbi:MAG: helix-turn-helix domain-containing protein [Anaerobiospirillum sp.]|nr:helix-turn-helix domain-containing protein [Anaerobiospirillum sp.]